MKKISGFLKYTWQFALLGGFVILLVLALRLTRSIPGLSPGAETVYPPPQASPRALPTEGFITETPQPTLDPFIATERALSAAKETYAFSPSQIAKMETSIAEQATYNANELLITPPPPPTPVYYPVNSIADFPKVVFNDPFFGNVNNGDFGVCLKANQPGEALLIKSLNQKESPDYYMLPFFTDGQVCSLYRVDLTDHMGSVSSWSSANGKMYPPVSADDARRLVEKVTGLNISDGPFLGFQSLYESMGPDWPFWVVTASDGQTYYVIYGSRVSEYNSEGLAVEVFNAKEVHPINP